MTEHRMTTRDRPNPPTVVTGPCVVLDMPDHVYHSDPVEEGSLSASGAKVLLKSAARFRYEQDHPKETAAMDYGTAAHHRLLGVGPEIVAVKRWAKDGTTTVADDWRSPSTTQHRDELRAEGKVGMLAKQLAVIDAMVAELWTHPYTALLFKDGVPETSLFWRDKETGIMLRGRLDWRTTLPGGRPCIVDYKTTASEADPDEICWDARKYRWHMQDDQHREGADTLLEPGHAFVYCVQEKEPPFMVAYHELDDDSRERGRYLNAVARARYLECMTKGEWPGYPPVVHSLHIPNDR